MCEWRECKLGDVVVLNYGKGLPEHKRIEGNVPVYSSAGLTGYHNKPLVNSEGLIIGRKGTVGKIYYSRNPFYCIDTAYYILPDNEKYSLDFIYYLLKTIGLEELNEDSAVPGLNRNTAYSQNILLPPLPEQRAIASVLSSLDDKIDLLHRQNQTLEAMAETLFRQGFVEEADEGWEEGVLNDVISVKGGTTPSTKKSEYWDGDIYWTSPRDLSNHTSVFIFDTGRKITERGLAQIGSGLLPIGTVLLSSRAPIGYLAITEIPLAINQGYIAIVCDKMVSNYFIYLWCKANMDGIKNQGNGSVFQEIAKSVFKEISITIPLLLSLDDFDKTVNPILVVSLIN
ncbi:MAG: restriction endonuclease subunit S [Methanosarcinales archaeon]|nr:restriction endonuclease subunit S [Methanosarcinales archaeon]